jgi:hypothetical protein
MSEHLEEVLADAKSDADRLARLGFDRESSLLRDFAQRVERASLPWLNYLSEADAALFSALQPRVLRRRFPEWERRGFARKQGRTRFYCEAILPRRAELVLARNEGRAAARGTAA